MADSIRTMGTRTFVAMGLLLAACQRDAAVPSSTAPTPQTAAPTTPVPAQPVAPPPGMPMPAPTPVAVPTTTAPPAPPENSARRGNHGSTGGTGAIGAGSSNPAADQVQLAAPTGVECQTDRDCSCGIDRTTGACAVGPMTRVDPSRQCPDFCGGIDGRMRTVCTRGRCAQAR